MNKSLYFNLVEKYFPNLVLSITEKLNEKPEGRALTYLHKELLTPAYSADGRWASITAQYSRVMADVVSLDSELPLKSRDSLDKFTGDIPKVGMKLYLSEKQLKDIQSMIAQGLAENLIVQKIFADTARVITGVEERMENIFLEEFSTGVGLAQASNGNGIRINVGYLDDHKFATTSTWDDGENAKIIDDIQKLVDKATLEDQNDVLHMWTDDTFLNRCYKNKQIRGLFGFQMNYVGGGANVPNLSFDQLSAVFMTKWGITLHRVARVNKAESNGVRSNVHPWAKGMAVFTDTTNVGNLVWTDCVEALNPVAGVSYETADEYILVSKYSKNEPYSEFTASQAMAIPVINNVDRIYTLDSNEVAA